MAGIGEARQEARGRTRGEPREQPRDAGTARLQTAVARFRTLAAGLLAVHFVLLAAELQQPAPPTGDGAAMVAASLAALLPSLPEAELLSAAAGIAALLSLCAAARVAPATCSALVFLIGTWLRRTLAEPAADDLFACLCAFWLFWLWLPAGLARSRRRGHARPHPPRATIELPAAAYLIFVWVCYWAPQLWSDAGTDVGWHRALALAPLLYLAQHPLAVGVAVALQVGVHGWLAATQDAPITQALFASSALLFRANALSLWERERLEVFFGGVATTTMAALAGALVLLNAAGLSVQAQRVQRTLATVGLELVVGGAPTQRFVVVEAAQGPHASTPLSGPWFDRRWRKRLELALGARHSPQASLGGSSRRREAWALVSTHCSSAGDGGGHRLVAIDERTRTRRTLAGFYCDRGEAIGGWSDDGRGGRDRAGPYAL